MNKNLFEIGDRVAVKPYEELPAHLKTRAVATLAGKQGVIVDILFSEKRSTTFYIVHLEGYDNPSSVQFTEDSLNPAKADKPVSYRYEIECLPTIVLAKLYEVCGDESTEIARGHGHIIHEGEIGAAQAGSYALKKIYEAVGGFGRG